MTGQQYCVMMRGELYYVRFLTGHQIKTTLKEQEATRMSNAEAHMVRNHIQGMGIPRAVVVPAEVRDEQRNETA